MITPMKRLLQHVMFALVLLAGFAGMMGVILLIGLKIGH